MWVNPYRILVNNKFNVFCVHANRPNQTKTNTKNQIHKKKYNDNEKNELQRYTKMTRAINACFYCEQIVFVARVFAAGCKCALFFIWWFSAIFAREKIFMRWKNLKKKNKEDRLRSKTSYRHSAGAQSMWAQQQERKMNDIYTGVKPANKYIFHCCAMCTRPSRARASTRSIFSHCILLSHSLDASRISGCFWFFVSCLLVYANYHRVIT